jgi:hypothetical protein
MHHKLPDDVIYLILLSLLDLRTLNAAVQVSKHVYTVFKEHDRFILGTFVQREAGPAAVQASRLAFVQRGGVLWDLDNHPRAILKTCIPDEEGVDMVPADWDQARILSENASSVKKIEFFFVRRCECPLSICFGFLTCYLLDLRTRLRHLLPLPLMNHSDSPEACIALCCIGRSLLLPGR